MRTAWLVSKNRKRAILVPKSSNDWIYLGEAGIEKIRGKTNGPEIEFEKLPHSENLQKS